MHCEGSSTAVLRPASGLGAAARALFAARGVSRKGRGPENEPLPNCSMSAEQMWSKWEGAVADAESDGMQGTDAGRWRGVTDFDPSVPMDWDGGLTTAFNEKDFVKKRGAFWDRACIGRTIIIGPSLHVVYDSR